jgi:hypothetical protein
VEGLGFLPSFLGHYLVHLRPLHLKFATRFMGGPISSAAHLRKHFCIRSAHFTVEPILLGTAG